MTATFELFRDAEGLYRFQLKAVNGEVVADSQAYSSVEDARTGMAAVQRAAADAQVPDSDADIAIQDGIHMHFVQRPPE